MIKACRLLTIMLICYWVDVGAQFGNNIDYIFMNNGNYKYFTGTSAPDTNWYKPEFTDSTWTAGNKSIGYGDGDDTTLIDTTISVYLRIRFTLNQLYDYLNFITDYDDGFVAYLNGVEMARTNLGKKGEYISYNRLADRSHEAQNYRSFFRPVQGYYIDSTFLAKAALVGENILAIEVHNDSIKGSDLTFNSSLLYFYNLNEYFIYQDQLRFIKQVQLDSTRFPIVSVQTGESGIASSSEKYIAHLSIISNQEGGYNRPSDIPTDYDGRISIELRGKTSLHWPKKSYNIETQNASGENLNVSLLGMPPENDWILQGPFGDKSLFRNVFAYMLGNKLGYYEPRTRFCELIINGEFLGLYVLTEKIKRDSLRVDIASLRPEDIAGSELTGGYIVKYDKDAPGLISVYPRKSVINITQWAYITGFFNDFYLVLDKPEFLDIQHGYKKYIDEQTLIDYIIVNESFRNCDAYKYSTYMHKDKDTRDARIKFGPLWDFDFSLGNVTYQDAHLTDGWQFEINKQLNITKVMRDTVFVKELKERWFDLRKGLFHPDTLKFLIDSLVNHIKVARERNYEVWPVIQYALTNYDHASTYEQELYNLKNFLMARTSWIDNDIRHIFYPALVFPSTLKSLHVSNHVVVYPNPFSDYLMVECKQAGQGSYLIEITDLLGRKVFEMRKDKLYSSTLSFTIRLSKLSSLTNGLYVISITYNDRVLFRERIMKQ